MPISDKRRELRRTKIGSSDTPAICGVSPFSSAYDVYASKIFHTTDAVVTPAMDMGNRMEPVLIAWCQEKLGKSLISNQYRISKQHGFVAANHDALVGMTNQTEGVEAKVANFPDGWGEAGTDEVPPHVYVQCQHQMFVSGLEKVWVPALITDYRPTLVMYEVPRDEEVIDKIMQRVVEFWKENVLAKSPPPTNAPGLDIMRRVIRVPNKVQDIPDDLRDQWEAIKKIKAEVSTKEKKVEAEILQALGDAEASQEISGVRFEYFENHRKGYEVKPSTYRVLRLKKVNLLEKREGDQCQNQNQGSKLLK